MTIEGTVLVIDDDEDFLEVIRDLLEKECNYRVYTATEEDDAFSVLDENKDEIDVILLDIIFDSDEFAGIEMLKKIKKEFQLIEVIMLTVKEEKTKQFYNALESNAFYYVTKPYDKTELKIIIRNAIERRTLLKNFDENRSKNEILLGLIPYRLENICGNIENKFQDIMNKIPHDFQLIDFSIKTEEYRKEFYERLNELSKLSKQIKENKLATLLKEGKT